MAYPSPQYRELPAIYIYRAPDEDCYYIEIMRVFDNQICDTPGDQLLSLRVDADGVVTLRDKVDKTFIDET